MPLILVHGANFSSTSWQDCLPYLRHATLAVDWPTWQDLDVDRNMSFDLIAQAVLREMDTAAIDVATLVGHSIGGHVINAVAERAPQRVRQLVFISAPILSAGERTLEVIVAAGRPLLQQWHDEGRRSFDMPAEFIPAFCNDMDQHQASQTVENLRPGSVALFFEPLKQMTQVGNIPCTYIKLLRDQLLTPAAQDGFIAKLPSCRVIALDAGHMAMISRPKELAAILNEIVE